MPLSCCYRAIDQWHDRCRYSRYIPHGLKIVCKRAGIVVFGVYMQLVANVPLSCFCAGLRVVHHGNIQEKIVGSCVFGGCECSLSSTGVFTFTGISTTRVAVLRVCPVISNHCKPRKWPLGKSSRLTGVVAVRSRPLPGNQISTHANY